MKFVFWSILAVSLTTVVILTLANLGETSTVQKDPQADLNESFDPNDLFPLAKRNGVDIRVEKTFGSPDKNIVRNNFIPSFIGGNETLKKIVDHPEKANGIQLTVAADMTYCAGNLKDAAFLYYAGEIRFFQDLDRYPPKDPQSSSANWFLSIIMEDVKADLMRDLYLEPKILADVVKRLEQFESKEPADYDPGWDYSPQKTPENPFAKTKAVVLDVLKSTSELLLQPDYFEAYRVYRASFDLSEEEQKNPAVIEGREKVIKAMKRIETEKNLHGVAFLIEQTSSD